MNFADRDKSAVSGIAPRFSQRLNRSQRDVSDIIPFPGSQASSQTPNEPGRHALRVHASEALRKMKRVLLRSVRIPDRGAVKPMPGSTNTSVSHCRRFSAPATQGQCDGQLRKRMCARCRKLLGRPAVHADCPGRRRTRSRKIT